MDGWNDMSEAPSTGVFFLFDHEIYSCNKGCPDVITMHGKNVEFGNLIHEKFCFWREIFAILSRNLPFQIF